MENETFREFTMIRGLFPEADGSVVRLRQREEGKFSGQLTSGRGHWPILLKQDGEVLLGYRYGNGRVNWYHGGVWSAAEGTITLDRNELVPGVGVEPTSLVSGQNRAAPAGRATLEQKPQDVPGAD